MAVHIQCSHCQQPLPVGAHVCPHCGTPVQGLDPSSSLSVHTPAPAQLPPIGLQGALPDALKQIDAAATTNITISGVLIAFYAGAIFAGKVLATEFYYALIYALPIVLLLITIILSLRVFYPVGYLTNDYPALLKTKDARLQVSILLLELSVALLAVSVFVYLQRPNV